MSIIQQIRDKAAWIIIGAIAVALIAFIVQDAFVGRGRGLFSGDNTVLGRVNGQKIDYLEFAGKMKRTEEIYTQQGYPMDEYTRASEENRLWNQYVERAVMEKIYSKLGLEVTEKEVGDILYGSNPPQDFARQFTDPNTGIFDANQAYQQVQQLKKQKNSQMYKSFFGEYVPGLIEQRKKEKFETLIAGSTYIPRWLVEKTNAENSQIAAVSYATIPYTSISDTAAGKISDAEIEQYVSKHKNEFKQSRSAAIRYVSFDASPSKADTAAVLQQLLSLRDSFAHTSNISAFLQQEYSQTPLYASNISRKEIKIANIDSIINNPQGPVYGPYLDQGAYVMARVVNVKQWPDTVKVRHILVATHQQQQNGQMVQVRLEDDAKKLADSLANAIASGSNFDSLCVKFSDDQGSKNQGGVYDNVVTGKMVAPFNDFVFGSKTGAHGVVKTEFGYHYIEILSQKGSSPAYEIAYFSKPILSSDETVNTAMGMASQFAAESRTLKDFEQNANKKNLLIFNADDIDPMATYIAGINGNTREMVRWIFREAKKGDVTERPFAIGDKFLVPVVTQLYEEGTKSAEKARTTVEPILLREKKAEIIVKKAGAATDLESVSKAMNVPVLNIDSLAFSAAFIPNVGQETRVIGAAFNKQNQEKMSSPIRGTSGVYFIRTRNVSAVPNVSFDAKTQQAAQVQQQKMMNQRSVVQNIINAADIKDYRYRFF